MNIVIASTNREKASLLKQFLRESLPGRYTISTLFNKTLIRDYALIETLMKSLSACTASSPLELAEKKARLAVSSLILHAPGMCALAEETLLTVPRIGNEEQAFTEKMGGIKKEKQILGSLAQYKDMESRSAFLSSFFAYACPGDTKVETVTSRMEGYIADKESGRPTFEYGSIFIKHEYAKTLSSLPESVLARVSQRKKGIERLCSMLS